MNEHLRSIPLDFSEWTQYGTVDPFSIEDAAIPGLRQDCYQTEMYGEIISAGVFTYKGAKTHVAWGVKSDTHCSFHALAQTDGKWGERKEGCPQYAVLRDAEGISGFTINTEYSFSK